MKKVNLEYKLSVSIIEEGDRFVAYSPALDLSTSGKTIKEVRERFDEAANLFFEEIISQKSIKEVLNDLGWKYSKTRWIPPMIISQESQAVCLPA